MVGQPQRDLGDLAGPVIHLDAEHLVHIDAGHDGADQLPGVVAAIPRPQRIQFQPPQFAIGNHEEVAAAAGGVEDPHAAQAPEQRIEPPRIPARRRQFGPQRVQEKRVQAFQDVLFGRVVLAAPPALRAILDGLEQAAENGGRDAGPIDLAAFQQRGAHGGIGFRHRAGGSEQPTIHIGKGAQALIHRLLPRILRLRQRDMDAADQRADIGAILRGALFDQFPEGAGFEDAGAVGEQAEQRPHHPQVEVPAPEPVILQQVMQRAELFSGFLVHRVARGFPPRGVAADEAEQPDPPRQVPQHEFLGRRPGFHVEDAKAREVGHDDVARQFMVAQAGEVVARLAGGRVEVLAPRFVLDEHHPFPEVVDAPPAADGQQAADRLFEGADAASVDAEDVEEVLPEGLRVGLLAACVPVFEDKGLRALANFVEG